MRIRLLRDRLRSRRDRSDCGAVLVEFAASVILLVTLAFGTVEFGLAWQDRNTLQTATRAGVRVGSNLGPASDTDYNVLLGVRSAITDLDVSNVTMVVVYKATAADGTIPTACANLTPPATLTATSVIAGPTDYCSAYSGAQLAALGTTITSTSFGCAVGATTGKLDCGWKPGTRQNLLSQGTGPDYLGVWIKVKHDFVTKLFGATMNLTDSAVMRLEPAG